MNAPIVTATRADIDIQIVDVTPDLAQYYLGFNSANRKLKSASVLSYARDMAEGRWVLNGEAIKFSGPIDSPLKLQDGQNRLHAVLKSQATVKMLVIFNVGVEAQATMDSGAKRTVADNLTIHGTPNASILGSAAALALRIEDGYLSGFKGQPTNSRTIEFLADNPDLERSAAVAGLFAIKADVPKSLVAYSHWRFSQLDLEEATIFWRDAAEKVDLKAGDPVLALTSRFASARRSQERVMPPAAVAAIFRVWNARRQGQTLRTIAFTSPNGKLPSLR